MKKSKLLMAAVAAIIISCSAYAGVTAMASDSAGTTGTTEAQAKDEVILSAEDLTETNLVGVSTNSTSGYGIYANADKTLYTIVADGGNKVSTINNSDSSITNIVFSTGCYENNVVLAYHADHNSTLLNLDGSYYSKITGYYPGITMQNGNTGRYLIDDGQNVAFYDKDGTKLFQIAGTGTVRWSEIKGYNVLDGIVSGVTYLGVYDNNLNKIYEAIYLANNGKYSIDDGTNTIFYGEDNIELFRVPVTGSYVSWSDFHGYNVLNIYNTKKVTTSYRGLYNNNLVQVIPTPPNCGSIFVSNDVLKYSCFTTTSTFYYYDSNLQACAAPVTTATTHTLENGYTYTYFIEIDGIKFYVGYKSDNTSGKYVTKYALFNTSGKLVYENFSEIYPNGLCTVRDEALSKFKLVQLSAKILTNASKSGITLGSNNFVTGDISVAVNVNSADTTVTEPLKIHIEAANNVIPDGASLCAGILKAADGEHFVLAQTAVASIASKFTVFDIDLLSASNMKVQPDGNVKITLGIPSTYSTSALKVYRIELDGSKTDMNATIVGGNIIFETNHFSIYVLSDETVVKVSDVVNTSVPTPDATPPQISPTTYDGSPITYYVIIAVLAIGCLSTILLFNKKKYNKE